MKSRVSGRKPNQHLASPRHSPASAYCTFDFLTMPTVLHFQTNHVAQSHINSNDRHHRRKSYGRPGARAFRREQKVAASLGASEASLRKQLRLRTVPTSPGRYKPTFSPERGEELAQHCRQMDGMFYGITKKSRTARVLACRDKPIETGSCEKRRQLELLDQRIP